MAEDLSRLERRLADCVARGAVLDCAPGGTTPDAIDAVDDWDARLIRADVLADLAADAGAERHGWRRRGVRLRGALIAGRLDLAHSDLDVPIALDVCRFEVPVELTGARLRSLSLTRCELPALTGDELEVTHSVHLDQSIVGDGPIRLGGARVGGDLVLTGAKLAGTDERGRAFVARRLQAGTVSLDAGFEAAGSVWISGAAVDSSLDMGGAKLKGTDDLGRALDAVGLRVGDDAVLTGGFEAAGALVLRRVSIEGNLDLTGARLTGTDGDGNAFIGNRLRVGGGVRLRDGFQAAGAVHLWAADIGGQLDLRGARLTGPDANGDALVANDMHVRTNALLTDGLEVRGAVGLRGARIDGNLDLTGAKLLGTDHDGNAVVGDGLRVGGGARLRDGFESAGAVRLWGADIGAQLNLRGARLAGSDANGDALVADELHVGASAVLADGFEATGAVSLRGARIDGNLELSGARLAGADASGNALRANRLHVQGDLLMRDGLEARGDLRLATAAVNGHVAFVRARNVEGVVLEGARFGSLRHDRDAWPPTGALRLRGFQLGVLVGETDWRQQLDWVRRQGFTSWTPDPYEQLAEYYTRIGDESAARRIRIARHDDELTHLRRTRKPGSLAYRFWRRPFGWLLGYGYRRWPTGMLLAATLLAAGGVFDLADGAGAMIPSDHASATAPVEDRQESCGDPRPCFNAAVYGADVVLPVIDLGQDNAWRPSERTTGGRWAAAARWVFIAVGWVLASLFVAAFTRLVQRD